MESIERTHDHVDQLAGKLPFSDLPPLDESQRADLCETYRQRLLDLTQFNYIESAGIAALDKIVSLKLEDAYVGLHVIPRDIAPEPARQELELRERVERGELTDTELDEAERKLAEIDLTARAQQT